MTSIDELMAPHAGEGPGAALLVARDGVPLVRRAYGMADVERALPVSHATNFRLASISKSFTAAAVLLLAQDRKLRLSDGAIDWLPELARSQRSISIVHFLTHSSGLADYEGFVPPGEMGQLCDADVLDIVASHPAGIFEPGGGYRYNNGGYALLALIVERASGLPFNDFLKRRIFDPCGMHGTIARVAGGPEVVHRAFGHAREGEQWVRRDQDATSAVLGDGGVYSSIDDLLHWDAAWLDDRLLSKRWRLLATTPHVATDQPGTRYGLGWRITGDSIWHSGESTGFRNVLVRFPASRLTVIMLTNRDAFEPHETALTIADLFLGQ